MRLVMGEDLEQEIDDAMRSRVGLELNRRVRVLAIATTGIDDRRYCR